MSVLLRRVNAELQEEAWNRKRERIFPTSFTGDVAAEIAKDDWERGCKTMSQNKRKTWLDSPVYRRPPSLRKSVSSRPLVNANEDAGYEDQLGIDLNQRSHRYPQGGGGGHMGIFWVGICRPGHRIGTPL